MACSGLTPRNEITLSDTRTQMEYNILQREDKNNLFSVFCISHLWILNSCDRNLNSASI